MLPSLYWRRTVRFLRSIGLSVHVRPDVEGFLRHIQILDGELVVDAQCEVSTLLHEAGHLSCVPARYRSAMSGDLAVGHKYMLADVTSLGADPDSPLWRAVIQASDPEATAWAWAAGVHLGLPDEMIIQDDEYEGTGADMRAALRAGVYEGIDGLAHAGFCVTRPRLEGLYNLPAYPRLKWWLQAA